MLLAGQIGGGEEGRLQDLPIWILHPTPPPQCAGNEDNDDDGKYEHRVFSEIHPLTIPISLISP